MRSTRSLRARARSFREIYDRLLNVLISFESFREDPKRTSIHLSHEFAFAGVHPRKEFLILNLRTERPIDSPRVRRTEQVSKNRFHNDVKLVSPDDVDAELTGWLREAYDAL
ncbi:MAG: DUF5655 domain-containing protein [Chloroflexota bacterium]|nr:MAG: DNA replication protein DnaC [Chloroflexota bacterium]